MLTVWVAVYDNICETGVLPETPGFRSQRTLAQGINNLLIEEKDQRHVPRDAADIFKLKRRRKKVFTNFEL